MIEAATAQEIVGHLQQIEERLVRLLSSGWRQASSEAADLRHDADTLAEAGLTELTGRVGAVASANGAAEALPAIALAASACRLLRLRLLAGSPPDGWAPAVPPKPPRNQRTDTLLPISRALLDGREMWVCLWLARQQAVVLVPPFRSEEATEPAPASEPAPPPVQGVFGRLRRQIGRALTTDPSVSVPPSDWLLRRLRGSLRWDARHPFGTDGDVTVCTLEHPAWVTDKDEHDPIGMFRQALARNTLANGYWFIPNAGSLRVLDLGQADPAIFAWLDPTAAEAFGRMSSAPGWVLVWMAGAAFVPVAVFRPGKSGDPPRLVHLIPGTPEDVLAVLV